jgi:hypothetical protein
LLPPSIPASISRVAMLSPVSFHRPTLSSFCFAKANISCQNQHLHANYGNFNPSHTILIQRGAQKRWEE